MMSASAMMNKSDESAFITEREAEGLSPFKTFLRVSEDKRQELCVLNKIINNCHSDFIVHTKLNLIWRTVAGVLVRSSEM